jgi:hypothetical protein
MRKTFPLAIFLSLAALAQSPQTTVLWQRGYSVVPSPRDVRFTGGDIVLDRSWTVDAGRFGPKHIAVRTLVDDARAFHGLSLATGVARASVKLSVSPGTVATKAAPEMDRQA